MTQRTIQAYVTPVPAWWRMLVIAVAALSMCACRAPFGKKEPPPQPVPELPRVQPQQAETGTRDAYPAYSISDEDVAHASSERTQFPHPVSKITPDVQPAQHVVSTPPALPEMAYTGAPPEMVPSASLPTPYPQQIMAPDGQWSPAGLPCPWPRDEYLFDGGDRALAARVQPNWDVLGLDQEDTIVHYDTVAGETIVQPSNTVKIYSPRFAAVRKVTGAAGFQSGQHLAGAEKPTALGRSDELTIVGSVVQPLQPGGSVGLTTAPSFRDTTRGLVADAVRGAIRLDGDLPPYEDFLIVRRGEYDNTEKARLVHSLHAAAAWTHNAAVQVMIDEQVAAEVIGDSAAQSTYLYEIHGKPRVRIVKLASKAQALPGEEVEFTLRFDNVGDQIVGNVTIIDSLTTRLEYVEDSQICNLKATFMTQVNEGDSLVLRWEITEPLAVGDGGVIRFKCRVR